MVGIDQWAVVSRKNNGEESFGSRWSLRMSILCRMHRAARMLSENHAEG